MPRDEDRAGADAVSETLPLGKLGRPHGVRGEIYLRPFNDGAELPEVLPAPVWLVRGEEKRKMTLVAVRPANDVVLVRLEGIDTREAAAALTNAELWLPRALLAPLEEGEAYVEDLIGCTVVDGDGRVRGTVKGTFWNGAQDVLTVQDPAGAEWFVPAVPEFIREIDLEARRLVVDPHE